MELGDSATMTRSSRCAAALSYTNYTGGAALLAIGPGWTGPARQRSGGEFEAFRHRTTGLKDMRAEDMFCV
jgi:hypothetical protein